MEDDDEPLPPRSLKDQVQEAYAAENMHLARVLHLKLHGIEVTSDDDPRIAQVRDEDFDFGHLELDEDMLEAMREAEAELKARRDLEAVAPKSLKGRVVRGQPTASSKRGHARKLPPSTLRISVSFYYKFQLLYKLSNTFSFLVCRVFDTPSGSRRVFFHHSNCQGALEPNSRPFQGSRAQPLWPALP